MYREMTTSELQEQLQAGAKVNLIDVREPEEWEEGHIAEARLIPLSEFQARAHEVHDVEGEVVFICRSGGRSGRVCEHLSLQGFDVVNVAGGMLAWTGDVVTGK
ncbi:rhodanese-like domain-containing protein [Paenibacillus sp. 1011MAR3C5]|uniref:rhodanese-like domain-containing protein n=1 Tax=Paenibacillus sp. 1011MAR3C5 TaxID=1675787 RepID=UPI000E6CF123|nr:rhodanese-like domain-containing protein [Paenibacillus sp. 1011MAR3C5]RJE86854.1 rhodanese-like domain-containing protein [Paenibacillus sp. 1011MAR3C5]